MISSNVSERLLSFCDSILSFDILLYSLFLRRQFTAGGVLADGFSAGGVLADGGASPESVFETLGGKLSAKKLREQISKLLAG